MILSSRHMLAGFIALLMAGGAASAQDTATTTLPATLPETNSVGNPQLRNFELPGTRTTPATPPSAFPTPLITLPPAAVTTPRPQTQAPAEPAAPAPRSSRQQPAAAPATTAAPGAQATASAPQPTPPPPLPEATETAPPPATPTQPIAEPRPSVTVAPAPPPSNGIPWLYIAIGAAAAALALFAFWKLRRRRSEEEDVEAPVAAQPEAAPRPDPLFAQSRKPAQNPLAPAAPTAPAQDLVSIQMRPWLEIQFKPARAAATATEASVQFELTIVNSGNAPAQNIRVGSRMFSAGPGQEREVEAFYAEPFPDEAPIAVPLLPPETAVKLTSGVALAKDQVREVEIQGQRLFIPTVAFNVTYEWANGKKGQTSNSYLVGREAETPSPKMGGFRLDLGPRLYRSVGQRPTTLARAV